MDKPRISAIAAISENRGLGKDNTLLFHLKGDFERMKALTMGHPIIMGRKTFASIGRSLPGRTNIVVTRDNEYKKDGIIVCNSVESAIEEAKKHDREEVFIFGGGEIYQQAMPYTDRLYLTIVNGVYEADTFFPDYAAFTKVIHKEEKKEDGYTYTFLDVEK